LINPPGISARFAYSTFSHPPIGLAYIAACLEKAGIEVRILDAVGLGMDRYSKVEGFPGFFMQGLSFEDIVEHIDPSSEYIGISCMFTHSWPVLRQLIGMIRSAFPGATLFAGGEHATALPGLCLSQSALDVCVLGEGEETAVDMIRALMKGDPLDAVSGIAFKKPETGEITVTGRRKRIRDLTALPWPAWDKVPPHGYTFYVGPRSGKTMPMVGSRGCPFACGFCASQVMWGRCWEKREPSDIVDEMAHYASVLGTREFQFFDISPFLDRSWTEKLCEEIKARLGGIKWQVPAGVRSEVIDSRIAGLLYESGFRHIQFAAESGSPRVLSAMDKQLDPQ
jgi:radical SAM superfamily enzyme YgiQ (UPF0313 family)